MGRMRVVVLIAVLAAALPAGAQTPARDTEARIITALRAAMKSSLPFPDADETGSPADGIFTGPWLMRPLEAGDKTIEVLANPLNAANQARSAKAMSQIEDSIEAAQRKAEAQYQRALAEVKRTGKSQDVDGVTLADEGIAGARIDADGHVIIDVEFNQPAYAYAVASSLEPAPPLGPAVAGAVAALSVPSHVYRDRASKTPEEDRFCVAEAEVFFGAMAVPTVKRRSGANFEITASEATPPAAAPIRTLVVRLRGNQELIDEIVRKADWSQVQALVK